MSFDWGMGTTNIDKETGIRYGVIPANAVGEAWDESSEAQYGDPTCAWCGSEDLSDPEYSTVTCKSCGKETNHDQQWPEDPISYTYEDEGYVAEQSGGSVDIFILKSEFYTLCGFCSPCAPGAGYLLSEGNVKTYCFNHDWFEDGVAPYSVYRVASGELVNP